jgi:hypothetical protein
MARDIAADIRLDPRVKKVTSQPDRNTINLQVIRPDNDQTLPCVYSIFIDVHTAR